MLYNSVEVIAGGLKEHFNMQLPFPSTLTLQAALIWDSVVIVTRVRLFFHELLDNSCLLKCGNDAGYVDLDTSYEL